MRDLERRTAHVTDERGDIIIAYLVRLVGGLALVGLLVIESVAVTLNRIGLEETVDRAARAGASAYAEHRSADAVERAVDQRLQRADTELVDLDVGGQTVSVTGVRSASVLLSDRIDALSSVVTPERTGQAEVSR